MSKRTAIPGTLLALALAGGNVAALAQAPDPAPAPERKSVEQRQEAAAKRNERFKAADKNGDGGLSREELAQTHGFAPIREHFDAMDMNKDGKVTMEEFRTWNRANRSARRN